VSSYSPTTVRVVECAQELVQQVGTVAMAEFEADMNSGIPPQETLLRHLSLLHVALVSDTNAYVSECTAITRRCKQDW
jgi:hypothetical protein